MLAISAVNLKVGEGSEFAISTKFSISIKSTEKISPKVDRSMAAINYNIDCGCLENLFFGKVASSPVRYTYEVFQSMDRIITEGFS
jgi:hypothetical protein